MTEEFNHKHYNYRWTQGFLLALCVVLLLISGAVLAQNSPNTPSGYSIDSTTGNLIQNSTMTSGTSWTTSGMTGSYTPDGYIFSYSSGTIQQDVNFNAINFGYLANNAVYATGIMYGFKYRFQCAQSIGTSCETGTLQDTLNATFTYMAPNGTVEQSNVHQLGLKNINDGNPAYNPVWQQLAETYTFAGSKNMSNVGTARLSITGMDAGFWACNPDCYGPQVKDAYMRLNYSVDPCILNPAFNPSCPGFQNVLQGSKSPTFYYSYNIAQSLPHIGGGVVLHGYDYGFNWYNYGSCYNTFLFWCTDWRTDGGGNINFRISDKNNTTMLQNQWYVSGNNSGGSYSNRFLFTESRNSLDMGSVQWWASDVWNHFGWVGWTRPIWTPDPCYTNGLYSPNCSNFKDTLNQVLADIKVQQEKIASLNTSSTTLTPGGTITTTINDVTTTNPSVSVVTSPQIESNISQTQTQQNNTTNLALDIISRNRQQQQTIENQAVKQATTTAQNIASSSMTEALNIASMSFEAGVTNSVSNTSQVTSTNVTSNVVQTSPFRMFSQGSTNIMNTAIGYQQQNNSISQIENGQIFAQEPLIPSQLSVEQQTNQTQFELPKQEEIKIETFISVPVIVQFEEPKIEISEFKPPAIVVQNEESIQPIVEIELPKVIAIEVQQMLPPQQAQIISEPIITASISLYVPPEQSKEEIVIPKFVLPKLDAMNIEPEQQKQEILVPPQAPVFAQQEQPVQFEQSIQVSSIAPIVITPVITESVASVIQNIDVQVQPKQDVIIPAPVIQVETIATASNFTTDKTNPINEIIENKQTAESERKEPIQTTSVNRNTQNNEAAGNVDISSIATQPPGFNQYASLVLRDAAFYAPKEIYRGQKTVDNARALRQLASDRLHQEMVNQQYLPR